MSTSSRRKFLQSAGATALAGVAGLATTASAKIPAPPMVRTVLGPIAPSRLGCTLTHEHAPLIDWSELYETRGAPTDGIEEEILAYAQRCLTQWHDSLPDDLKPGTIVECTPIRVGRYPDLLVQLARRVPVHIVGCTGFWCEAAAPQHPWAIQIGLQKDGVRQLADLFIREIREGMEDPSGAWGEKFTRVRAGIIKCATSKYMRPSERRCHEAAAIASIETGCPITTHTTDGGGREQAELLLQLGVRPEKIIIGHQGHMDDRKNAEALEYHRKLAELGCYVQYDRVGHREYSVDKTARLIQGMVEAGFGERVLVAHDHVPYAYRRYWETDKPLDGWQKHPADFSIASGPLARALEKRGVAAQAVRSILVHNPQRVLAF